MAKSKNHVRSRQNRGHRVTRGRSPKPLVVFAVEGATERVYINALIAHRYGNRIAPLFAETRDKSSLTNLVSEIKRKMQRDGGTAEGAWIVCDTDANACHREQLETWLSQSERHRVAISHPCIEYWFVLHFKVTARSLEAQHVVKELEKEWPGGKSYKKGAPIPPDLINATENAIKRVRTRRQSLDSGADVWNSSQWTDMPELVEWLDDLDSQSSARTLDSGNAS